MNRTELQIGDRVAYSRQWLRSTGHFTGPIPFARGRITAFEPLGRETVLAVIDWDGGHSEEIPERVNVGNLAHVGPNVEFAG